MYEPWRVAVVGPEFFPHANSRVYSRLKVLQRDWPKVTFHIITGATGAIHSAALRAAKKLGMSYTSAAGDAWPEWERMIAYWDFEDERTRSSIHTSLSLELHTEVWDRDNEPCGPRAAEAVMGR